MAGVIGLWALATPVFGSADEPAHATRAAAVARGELTGATPSPERRGFVSVRLPAAYGFATAQAVVFSTFVVWLLGPGWSTSGTRPPVLPPPRAARSA